MVGWKVMSDAAVPEVAAEEDEDEDEDEDDAKAKSKTDKPPIPYGQTQPDLRETRITRYNVFCPTCVPAEAEAEAEALTIPGTTEVKDSDYPEAVKTQLPLALIATMEAEDPGISLATIMRSETSTTGVYAEGEQVLDDVSLLAVDLGIVYLRNASRVEYLQMSAEAPPPPKTRGKDDEKKGEPKKKNKYSIDGAADAIKCDGNSCTVERKFINQLLANPAALATQAAARPYSRDVLSGFQLSRVRKGTIPRLMGLRSGDVITSINGQPLETLDGAMKLYAKMRNASNLTVDYVRNRTGTREQHRLDIQII